MHAAKNKQILQIICLTLEKGHVITSENLKASYGSGGRPYYKHENQVTIPRTKVKIGGLVAPRKATGCVNHTWLDGKI